MDSKTKKIIVKALAAFGIIVVAMIGLYLKVEFSGWALAIGGIVAVSAAQE